MSVWQVATWAVPAVLVFWCVGAYNRLVRLRNRMAQAFVQIDLQLKHRHGLAAQLVDAMRQHAAEGRDLFDAAAAACSQAKAAADVARTRPTSAGAVTSLSIAEQVLAGALAKLTALRASLPALAADPGLQGLADALAGTEHKLAFSRQLFNDATLDYNQAIRQFPTRLLTPMFGFKEAALLQAAAPGEAARNPL